MRAAAFLVKRTILNALRDALRINSGILFLFVNRENLRIFPIYFFTGEFWNELPQSKPIGFDSSLWEGALGIAGKFPAKVQSLQACCSPLGELSRSD